MGAILTEDKLPSWHALARKLSGVWLTKRETYEPTAFPAVGSRLIKSVEELAAYPLPTGIIIPETVHTLSWDEWAALHKSSSKRRAVKRMRASATKLGSNFNDYRVSLQDVPFECCHFQIWMDRAWSEVFGLIPEQPQVHQQERL